MKWPDIKGRRLGVRTQIFGGFVLFTAITVALLWVFQIALLNPFYKLIKQNEIRRTADFITGRLYDQDLSATLYGVRMNTGIDVMITDQWGRHLIDSDVLGQSSRLFKLLSADKCRRIYAETQANGGEFSESYTTWLIDNGISREAFPDEGGIGRQQNVPEGIVYLRTLTTARGDSLLLIFNTIVTPVDSTVDTLKIQLWCLTGVMILLSGVLALVLSRRISGPISKINSGALSLAAGDYRVEFEPEGGRETRQLAETLNYAAGELSKVEGLRRELLANVSHDLRTPLTMISGYAEVMRDLPGENTPENVQIIIDEATRLKDLVNDLLDISKLEEGRTELNLSRVNLTESIRQILGRYDKLADYSFDFYHGEDIFVMGDVLKLSQVVYNLVNNAITHTGPDKRVVLSQTAEGGQVKIEICDSGEGIPPDKLKDIWERYYKVDTQHKRAQVGTGLGLSIVRKILELHGGSYGVSSREGAGSTFWFLLQIADPVDKSDE